MGLKTYVTLTQEAAFYLQDGTADGGTKMLIGGGEGLHGNGDLGCSGGCSGIWSCPEPCSRFESMHTMMGGVRVSLAGFTASAETVSGARKLMVCIGYPYTGR